MLLTRTRREGTMVGIIIALLIMLIVGWLYIKLNDAPKSQPPQGETIQGETIQGPNPDGSWGKYAEPMVKVSGVQISTETAEATIFMVIDIDGDMKYGVHLTLPTYPLTQDAVNRLYREVR